MARLRQAELPRDRDLALARTILERYAPKDSEQRKTRDAMLSFVELHPRDAHLRTCVEGHLTASALVIDRSRGKALLTFHKKLNRWLQLGGHCDGDANLAGVALRECWEESGIDGLQIDPEPIDLDIHLIPARKDEPAHLHLDTRFHVYAPARARETLSEESHSLAWFDEAGLRAIDTDASVRRLFTLAFGPA
ncbi:MAG: NUDIX hydrolase [Planctomycetes bacterium]|nr:NUDIX hydrolase [Planctomycetota bacterium]